MVTYVLSDVRAGYVWLGHRSGLTELNALHPDYKRGDREWNREHRSYPRIRYVRTAGQLEEFVAQYAGSRLLCYGINPRPSILTNEHGHARSAKDEDLTIAQNLVLDFDLRDPAPDRLERLAGFLDEADRYLAERGFVRPARAFTGQGYHLLFAFPAISIKEHSGVPGGLRAFRDEFANAHARTLAQLGARLDRTQDLRRMVRVYGTAKPGVGIPSTFLGGARAEDSALREYLIAHATTKPADGHVVVTGSVPSWFASLLACDERVRNLWHGTGKTAGDTSRSGYDYSLAVALSRRGHNDRGELASILAQRPNGAGREKGHEYVVRTVQRVLGRRMP